MLQKSQRLNSADLEDENTSAARGQKKKVPDGYKVTYVHNRAPAASPAPSYSYRSPSTKPTRIDSEGNVLPVHVYNKEQGGRTRKPQPQPLQLNKRGNVEEANEAERSVGLIIALSGILDMVVSLIVGGVTLYCPLTREKCALIYDESDYMAYGTITDVDNVKLEETMFVFVTFVVAIIGLFAAICPILAYSRNQVELVTLWCGLAALLFLVQAGVMFLDRLSLSIFVILAFVHCLLRVLVTVAIYFWLRGNCQPASSSLAQQPTSTQAPGPYSQGQRAQGPTRMPMQLESESPQFQPGPVISQQPRVQGLDQEAHPGPGMRIIIEQQPPAGFGGMKQPARNVQVINIPNKAGFYGNGYPYPQYGAGGAGSGAYQVRVYGNQHEQRLLGLGGFFL